MKDFKQTLNKGEHILALPLDKEYKLDELFTSDLTGSYIEKLNSNGRFDNKEKILFQNNEFLVTDEYKILKPFETIKLELKRDVNIHWQIDFKSNSFIKKEELKLSDTYDKNKALQLMQLCALIYKKESYIKDKILKQYKFDDFFYFSKQNHKNFLKKGFFNMFYTLLKSKTKIVDLQFMKLTKFDSTLNKEVITLVFQGSQEPEDWMTNMTVKKANYFDGKDEVHQGFYDSLQLFLRTVNNKTFNTKNKKAYMLNKDIDFLNKDCKIILTGHSLGGAVATLVACYLNDLGVKKENMSVYTFGAPPVGSKEFCLKYKNKLDLYRVFNQKDIIPKIERITSLKHLGQEVILESNENEIHSCSEYIDNLIDDLNKSSKDEK